MLLMSKLGHILGLDVRKQVGFGTDPCRTLIQLTVLTFLLFIAMQQLYPYNIIIIYATYTTLSL